VIYSASTSRPRRHAFRFTDDSTDESPVLDVSGAFDFPAGQSSDIEVSSSTLELGTKTFLAYGYVSEDARPNKAMSSLRKQPFTGEIIIFQKGTLIPVLLQPRAKKPILNKVVTAFAKRLEDAYSTQTSLNEVILVSRPAPPTLTLQNSNNAHASMEHDWQHDLLDIADDADAYHSDSSPPTSEDDEVSDDNALAQSPSPQIPGRFST
ncbi:hypothetical protein DXG01_012679, partial [Tephrocybe rancida]